MRRELRNEHYSCYYRTDMFDDIYRSKPSATAASAQAAGNRWVVSARLHLERIVLRALPGRPGRHRQAAQRHISRLLATVASSSS
jgi:hypothetical protein